VFLRKRFHSKERKKESKESLKLKWAIGQQECVVNDGYLEENEFYESVNGSRWTKLEGKSHEFSCELLSLVTLLFLAVTRK
jgi:hypothetical protein